MSFFGVNALPHDPYRPEVGDIVKFNDFYVNRFGQLGDYPPGEVVVLHYRDRQCLVSWDGYEQWEWIKYIEPLSPLEALARAAE